MKKETKKTEEKKETKICKMNCELSAEKLKQLLMERTPGIFEREPSPAFNDNLDKLVVEIINLTKSNETR